MPYSVCGRLRHLDGVAQALPVEVDQLVPRVALLGREVGGRRLVERERLGDVGRNRGRHVGVNAEQSRRLLQRHHLRDGIPPVAALRHVVRVAEALHQRRPRRGDADGIPAGRRRLAGEAVARQRRDHEVEGVRCAAAMRRGIGQRIDDLQLLDDRAGPAVRDDHRQRILMLRADVDEMNVEAVDLGDELRQGVQPRLAPCASRSRSPNSARAACIVASCTPCDDVRDGFPFRPLRGVDAPTKVVDRGVGKLDGERPDSARGVSLRGWQGRRNAFDFRNGHDVHRCWYGWKM